jgi:acyl-coenzyme A thioesterase PaaI-like protein
MTDNPNEIFSTFVQGDVRERAIDELRIVTPLQQAHRQVGDALRHLMRALERTTASEAELEQLAAEITALQSRLPQIPVAEFLENANNNPAHRLRERSPFIGRANPMSLPLEMTFGPDKVTATATFDTLFEGPPNCLHGGYIAGIFDEIMGAAQTYSGTAGMTGRLTVHYRNPTPLNTELSLTGWLESVNGRKIICRGTLYSGDVLCAEAEGLFIAFDEGLIRSMFGKPEDRVDPTAS